MEIYDGNKRDTNNFCSTSFLQINSCGVQVKYENEMHILRKKGRCDYHILFVCEGECQVFYEKKMNIIKMGGFVFYPPNMRQEYILNKKTKTIWLHFNGYEVENILLEAKISFGIHQIPYSSIFEKMFLQLIAEHNNQLNISNEKGLLLTILFDLGKSINRVYTTENKISECIKFITTHYNTNISISELAASCNLSNSRFYHLFKTVTQMSPYKYQQELRINNAKLMLSSTNLSVSEISIQLGYGDPLYFSRLFKRKTGKSPMEFRKIHAGE